MATRTTTADAGGPPAKGRKRTGTEVTGTSPSTGSRRSPVSDGKTRTTRGGAATGRTTGTARKTAAKATAKTAARTAGKAAGKAERPVPVRRRVRPATTPVPMIGCDVPLEYGAMVQYAMTLSRATVGVPEQLQGSPENIVAFMTIARALQLPLATVMQNVFTPDDGGVGHRSRLLHMLARRAGHRLDIEHLDDTGCEGVIWLADRRGPIEVSYTMLEAVALGVTEPHRDRDEHWRRQPANMLRNRWVTRAVDWYCPEVKAGADFGPDGGLLVDGLAGEEDLMLVGLGPEVTRILNRVGEAGREGDPGRRYAALRGVWTDARLLLDTVIDEEGGTLNGYLSSKLTQARADATDATADAPPPADDGDGGGGGKARLLLEHSRAGQAVLDAEVAAAKAGPAEAGSLPCGCPMVHITATGAHVEGCAEAARSDDTEGADRR